MAGAAGRRGRCTLIAIVPVARRSGRHFDHVVAAGRQTQVMNARVARDAEALVGLEQRGRIRGGGRRRGHRVEADEAVEPRRLQLDAQGIVARCCETIALGVTPRLGRRRAVGVAQRGVDHGVERQLRVTARVHRELDRHVQRVRVGAGRRDDDRVAVDPDRQTRRVEGHGDGVRRGPARDQDEPGAPQDLPRLPVQLRPVLHEHLEGLHLGARSLRPPNRSPGWADDQRPPSAD
jgi:hypothetical protein